MKLTLIYDPINGLAIPDGCCEYAAQTAANNRGEYVVSSQLFFDHVRLAVKQGLISPDEVEIFSSPTKEIRIPVSKEGRLAFWPRGFCDYFERVLDRLLDFDKKE